MSYRDLDPESARQELTGPSGLRVLDVRTPAEHAAHRLPDSTLVPVQELHLRIDELDPDTDWLVVCAHGQRSVYACEFLAQNGFSKLSNLRGGLANWVGQGLPIEP